MTSHMRVVYTCLHASALDSTSCLIPVTERLALSSGDDWGAKYYGVEWHSSQNKSERVRLLAHSLSPVLSVSPRLTECQRRG